MRGGLERIPKDDPASAMVDADFIEFIETKFLQSSSSERYEEKKLGDGR